MTDFGTLTWSRRDDAIATDILELRRLLLGEPAVPARFHELASLRPNGQPPEWDARPALTYWRANERLQNDLERVWSQAHIDVLVSDIQQTGQLDENLALALSMPVGREGYNRRTTTGVLELVARSLAHRAAGASATEADARAVDELAPGWHKGVDALPRYRKRLRDRRG